MPNVLVAGVYLANRETSAGHVIYELEASRRHSVTQRWAAIALGEEPAIALPCTVETITKPMSKFAIINRLIGDVENFDWVIVCDDDIELPPTFLDDLIDVAQRCDFSLFQPARTHDSYLNHNIVRRLPGLTARRTRFVEIGPVTCIRRDAYPLILPFEIDGMGWGLDFVWPARIERAGLRMGIIDAVPIAHRIRKPADHYSGTEARNAMSYVLARNRSLSDVDALTVLEAYA